jgi:NAD/NADP transhydrogenase alpha subunit
VKLAVLKETADSERRVAATPETVKKFAALGAEVAVEAGAGLAASIADADYEAAGAAVGPREAALAGADAILGVQGPIRRPWRARSPAPSSSPFSTPSGSASGSTPMPRQAWRRWRWS